MTELGYKIQDEFSVYTWAELRKAGEFATCVVCTFFLPTGQIAFVPRSEDVSCADILEQTG